MPVDLPTGFDDETYAWGYAPPSHLEGELAVPIPDKPPSLDIASNQPVRLPSGVVAYRETLGHRQRMMELERQAAAARQASQQAFQDAQMFSQMSRVAKSTKDIAEARRTIDMLALQRELGQAKTPQEQAQAMSRHILALGSGYGSAMRAVTQPTMPFTPTTTTVDGTKLVQTAPNRFQQVKPPEALMQKPTVEDLGGGVSGVRISPQHYQVVQKPVTGLSSIDRLKLQSLYKQQNALQTTLGKAPADIKAAEGWKALHKGEMDELDRVNHDIAVIESKYGQSPSTLRGTIAVIGQGTREDPARPTTQEQFDSVPSKAFYINPKDGKTYQKK